MQKLGYFVLVLIALIFAWKHFYPSGAWCYKMTVTVETPEGVKTGSAVREVYSRTDPALLVNNGTHTILAKGDAVVIDLGSRG